MKLTSVPGLKNVRTNKFSYPNLKRNKTKSPLYGDLKKISEQNDKKVYTNPDDFWNDCDM